MGWAFRRRVKVIPGVYLNISKGGLSVNTGVKGASLTFRSDGVYRNLGLPGTGLYSREKVGSFGGQGSARRKPEGHRAAPDTAAAPPDRTFISADPLEITSEGLQGLQQAVIDANRQRQELQQDAEAVRQSLNLLNLGALVAKVCLLYFLVAPLRRKLQLGLKARTEALKEVSQSIANSSVSLAVAMDDDCRAAYGACQAAFDRLCQCQCIWDVTGASTVDQVRSRSAVSISYESYPTQCLRKALPGISSPEPPLVFLNRNGADIYLYPGFFVMYESPSRLGILDIAELDVACKAERSVATGTTPSDSRRVGEVWEKSNKDGSRDKRFTDNRLLPLVEYGIITFQSGSGIHEKVMFSNADAARTFVDLLVAFKALVEGRNQKGVLS